MLLKLHAKTHFRPILASSDPKIIFFPKKSEVFDKNFTSWVQQRSFTVQRFYADPIALVNFITCSYYLIVDGLFSKLVFT